MSEERYDLKESKRSVRELYPVLKDAHGNIIDGFSRLEADPSWRQETREYIKTPVQLWLARIIANTHRRTVSREERSKQFQELAKALIEEKPEIQKTDIPAIIADLTTFSERYVRELLPDEYKMMSKARFAELSSANEVEEESSEEVILQDIEEIDRKVRVEEAHAIEQTITNMIGEELSEVKNALIEKHALTEQEADKALSKYKQTYPDMWRLCYIEDDKPKTGFTSIPTPPEEETLVKLRKTVLPPPPPEKPVDRDMDRALEWYPLSLVDMIWTEVHVASKRISFLKALIEVLWQEVTFHVSEEEIWAKTLAKLGQEVPA